MPTGPQLLQLLVPFAAGPSVGDSQLWGVWNRRQRCWALPPAYAREAAERIAGAMVEAYASAFAERGRHKPRPCIGLRFGAGPHADGVAWGVWDRGRERWAERPCYTPDHGERIAAALNESFAMGLTDCLIGIPRRGQGPRSDRGPSTS